MSDINAYVIVPYKKFDMEQQELNSLKEAKVMEKDTAEKDKNQTVENDFQTKMDKKESKKVEINDNDTQEKKGENSNTGIEPRDEKKLSGKMKSIVKKSKCRESQLQKLIKVFNEYGGQKLNLSPEQVSICARSALGQSKKIHDGEQLFYNFLLLNNLFLTFCKNKSKYELYYPFWFKL